MRKWLTSILLLGTAGLPASAQAQYPRPVYPTYPYPYSSEAVQNPAQGTYGTQPMPNYFTGSPYGYQQAQQLNIPRPNPLQPAPAGPTSAYFLVQPSAAMDALGAPVEAKVAAQQTGIEPAALPLPIASTEPGANKEPVPPPLALPSPSASASPLACVGDNCKPKKCHFMIFGDFLYWTVHGADVPFAQAFDGIDPINSVPRGPVGVASPRFQPGVRVGGGASISENAWVVATFTYFRTDRDASLSAPNGDVLHNFLVFPNTTSSAVDSLTSAISYRIELYMGDLDYKCAFVNNSCLVMNWVAGVRYAHLDQNLVNTFQVTGSTTVDSHIDFDGVGPRVGIEGQYQMGCGIYGYGQGILNVLFGQYRGNTTEQNVFTGLVGQTSVTANRAIPVLEMELGLGWLSHNGCVRLSGGYYVGSWFNTMTMTSLSSGIGGVNFTTNGNNFRDTMVFDGFVLRAEFRF
jgi:Legionella pneumophila major outer membrane protein precursor